MKKLLAFATAFVFMALSSSAMTQPVTNFSDWKLYVCPENESCKTEDGWTSGSLTIRGSDWSASLSIENGKLSFDLDGSNDQWLWVGLGKNFGSQASIIITSTTIQDISGNAYAGIWHSIEEWPIPGIQDDEVTCQVQVESWDGCRSFPWKVRERADDWSYNKVLGRGKFGDFCGEWEVGQTKYLGYAMLMDQMYFWIDGYKSIHTFMPLVSFSSSQADFDPSLQVFVNRGDNNHINVDFNNITIQ